MEKFITAYLMGGLGNQMFQIANVISQATENNIPYQFRPESHTQLQGNNTKKYINNIFKKIRFVDFNIKLKRYNELTWEFYEKTPQLVDNVEFYGYYQSSKNFIKYKTNIIDIFSPSNYEVEYLKGRYPQILLDNTVSIHIRRGDYIKFPNIHPTISKSYIDKALDMIGDYSHLFVFSDDKNWAVDTFKQNNCTIVNDEDYYEMWLMSLCKHNIISNSTFSWWGSFLNRNEQRRIIAPSIWFGQNGPKNYQDIYEDNWEIINVVNKDGELIYTT